MKIECLTSFFIPHSEKSKNLVIVLHGRGDSLEGFRWLPNELDLPVNYLLVNAPDDYFGGYSWYDLEPNQLPGVLRSRRVLDELLNEVYDQGYPPENCVVFGFSQGSLMSFEWGGRTSRPLAGIVSISGYILDPETLLKEASDEGKQIPRFVSHGLYDDVLPYKRSESQVRWIQNQGFNIEFKTYPKDHTIDPRQELGDIRKFIESVLNIPN